LGGDALGQAVEVVIGDGFDQRIGAELAIGALGEVAELVEAVGEVLDQRARRGLARDRGEPAALRIIGLDGGDAIAELKFRLDH